MSLDRSISQRTVLLLLKNSQVLLGYKKMGFGKGNYLGIGGKQEDGETLEEATAREAHEEIKITKPKMSKVGSLTFLFPKQPDWSQQVHVYTCEYWTGKPQETEEIKPEWFDFGKLPLSEMWDDAQFWLPAILNGYTLKGRFVFNSDLRVTELRLEEENY